MAILFMIMIKATQNILKKTAIISMVFVAVFWSVSVAISYAQTQAQAQTQTTISASLSATLKEGYVVKSAADNSLYVIRGNKKITIPTMGVFNAAGLKATSIKVVPVSDIAAAASAVLIKSPEDSNVYLIKGDKRIWIPSVPAFEAAGMKWSDIASVAKKEKEAYAEARLLKSDVSDKVFVLDKGVVRHLSSQEVFNSYEYKWSDITILTAAEMNMYNLTSLIKQKGDSNVYAIENGRKHQIMSAEKFYTLGYNWNEVQEVNATEFAAFQAGTNVE